MDRPQFRSVLASALARAGGLELATPRMTAGIDGRRTGRRSGNALEFSEYRCGGWTGAFSPAANS